MTKSDFFEKKNKLRNSFIILRDQNRFKRFSKFYEKLTCEIFMIFCVKLQQQVLKLIKLFSWGKSNSEFSSKNGFKMGTKMKFFKFYERWVHIISLMFYMNLWQLKGLKLQKCGKILYCGFRIKRDPKWVLSFATNWCIEFFCFFCLKLQQFERWQLCKIILKQFLFWGLWSKMAPEWDF